MAAAVFAYRCVDCGFIVERFFRYPPRRVPQEATCTICGALAVQCSDSTAGGPRTGAVGDPPSS